MLSVLHFNEWRTGMGPKNQYDEPNRPLQILVLWRKLKTQWTNGVSDEEVPRRITCEGQLFHENNARNSVYLSRI